MLFTDVYYCSVKGTLMSLWLLRVTIFHLLEWFHTTISCWVQVFLRVSVQHWAVYWPEWLLATWQKCIPLYSLKTTHSASGKISGYFHCAIRESNEDEIIFDREIQCKMQNWNLSHIKCYLSSSKAANNSYTFSRLQGHFLRHNKHQSSITDNFLYLV